MLGGASLPGLGEAARTEPPGSVGLCLSRASPYQASQNSPPSPPSAFPEELHKGRCGGGAGVLSQEHSIPAAQTSGDPSQGQRPKGARPRSPHPFQGGRALFLPRNFAVLCSAPFLLQEFLHCPCFLPCPWPKMGKPPPGHSHSFLKELCIVRMEGTLESSGSGLLRGKKGRSWHSIDAQTR